MDPFELVDYLRCHRAAMLDAVAELVGHESPSRDKGALDALAKVLAGRFRAIGCAVEVVANPDGGDHVRARFGSGEGRPALVLGHFDTVWPVGTLAARPPRFDDGRFYGPGGYDMKASLVLLEFALRAFRDLRLAPPRPVVALLTSDEEIGSPTSRRLIEDEARASAYALVVEPPLPGGRLKTARKGVGHFTLTIEGRSAHAGVEPEKGVSAVVELAHQILHLQGLNRPDAGTSVNVGVVQGGTVSNVVPARATASVDVRVTGAAEARRIEDAVRALRPIHPEGTLTVAGGFNRPPMERTPRVAALFEKAHAIGLLLGLDLGEGSTGGGSDGNFTAALGLPTLDGLGVDGGGAHAIDEHILVDSLTERAALLASLLLRLDPPDRP